MENPDLIVENRGALIARTNFWSLPRMNGEVVVSINAGVFRVLLPRSRSGELAEMSTARQCVVSLGPWPGSGRRVLLEVLFDDGSRAPFSIYGGVEAFDQLPTRTDQWGTYTLTVWTEAAGVATLVLERPCRYRVAASLPCLESWAG